MIQLYKCENCEHFINHYRLAGNSAYKINCGHCGKTGKSFNTTKKLKNCEHYSPIEIKVDNKEADLLKEALVKIEDSLKEIHNYMEYKNKKIR